MRHAALVITHADWRLEVSEGYLAVTLRLLAVQIPGSRANDEGDDEYKDRQAAFHPASQIRRQGAIVGILEGMLDG